MLDRARRPTLHDLCAAAEVSVYTASRALGDFPGVAPATRLRVREAARAIGYVPNGIARSLKDQSSRTIGVLTANNANPYYATLVRALGENVQASGYLCFEVDAVADGAYDVAREARFVETLIEHRVAGVVLTYVPTGESLRRLADWRMPAVFVDCLPPPEMAGAVSVTTDNYAGSRAVGAHFAALGYRRWLFVGHTATWTSRRDRERGFSDAAAAAGAHLVVLEGGNDRQTACAAVSAYLATCPPAARARAVYASNEPLLNGTIRGLKAAGLRIPEEAAVVGFDDFDWADVLQPAVSVVDQKIGEIGRIAGDLIVATIAGRPVSPVVSRPALRIRASCGG